MGTSDQLLYQNHESTCVQRLFFLAEKGPLTPSIPEEHLGGCSVARRSVADQRVALGHFVTHVFSPGHLGLFPSSHLYVHIQAPPTPFGPSPPQKGELGGPWAALLASVLQHGGWPVRSSWQRGFPETC